jgi:hypothetical protein
MGPSKSSCLATTLVIFDCLKEFSDVRDAHPSYCQLIAEQSKLVFFLPF